MNEDKIHNATLDAHLDRLAEGYSSEELQRAREGLYHDIYHNGLEWDEDLISYRADMLINIEKIIDAPLSANEIIANMRDHKHLAIEAYCREAVEANESYYVEKYCNE